MYDFNIVLKDGTEEKEIHSFTFDGDNGIYKWDMSFNGKTGHKNYFLTLDECQLIVKAGGVANIAKFLRNSNYKDTMTVGAFGVKVINLNP